MFRITLVTSLLLLAAALAGCRSGKTPDQARPAVRAAAPPTESDAPSAPAISVEPATLDFGRMNQNETRNKQIIIRNVGNATLHLHDPQSACGCTIARLQARELAPGDSTVLRIQFSSQDFSGHQQKLVRIPSDDPERPRFEVTVTAEIDVPILTDPPRHLIFNRRIRRGESWTRQVTLTTRQVTRLQIEVASFDTSIMRVEMQNGADGDPRKSVMTVTTRADLPAGDYLKTIHLRTNVAQMPTLDFSVRATVLGPVKVNQSVLRLPAAQPGQLLQGSIVVTPTAGRTLFKITRAEIDLPGFSAEIEEIRPNAATRVTIQGRALPAGHPTALATGGRIKGTLRLFTDLPDQPELDVPVTYYLQI